MGFSLLQVLRCRSCSFLVTFYALSLHLGCAFASDLNSLSNQLGNGLVEISAVATLVGAPIAEAMTVGLKSAACLPWASMSLFGLLHVAKAALAAAVPDWLRESMGLQNEYVAMAIGLGLELKTA